MFPYSWWLLFRRRLGLVWFRPSGILLEHGSDYEVFHPFIELFDDSRPIGVASAMGRSMAKNWEERLASKGGAVSALETDIARRGVS